MKARLPAAGWAGAAGLLALCLIGDTAWPERQPVMGQLVAEFRAVVRDPATQWLVALCLVAYLAVFTVLRRRFAREHLPVGHASEKWLFLVLLWAALRYAVAYPAQPLGTGFLVLRVASAAMREG